MSMSKRVYGQRGGFKNSLYLTRIKLTPNTRWGQLYFHWFHRGDHDRDFHDHPYDFWTFPLRTYYEDVLDIGTGRVTRNAVKAFRVHFRPAEYAHIQIGAATYRWSENGRVRNCIFGGPTMTFVWHKPKRREWGFWVVDPVNFIPRRWTHWREYVYS